ncbi:MAG TPA: DUF454 domain-containing protein [Fastidiosipila sp.]|nr:DUF454 domain-containing protein [Fastidiosipila sp.]
MLFLLAGTLMVILAAIGVILPILPTTPFLIAAAAFFSFAKPEWVDTLEKNRIFGPYIEAYRKGLGISIRRKVFALSCLWITLIVSMILVGKLWLTILLILIGSGVTIHLLLYPTRRDKRS